MVLAFAAEDFVYYGAGDFYRQGFTIQYPQSRCLHSSSAIITERYLCGKIILDKSGYLFAFGASQCIDKYTAF